MNLTELSDDELAASVSRLTIKSRLLLAELVAGLIGIEDRGIHLRQYKSMRAYCMKQLSMSSGEAYPRLIAVELCRRFTAVLDALAHGRIHLTTLAILRHVLTAENVEDVLKAVRGKTTRQVRALFGKVAKPRSTRACDPPALVDTAPASEASAPPPSATQPDLPADVISLGEIERLMHARNLTGDVSVVIEAALDALVEKSRAADCAAASVATDEEMPTVVRHAMRCAYTAEASGEHCTVEAFLEWNDPLHTLDTSHLRLVCFAHGHAHRGAEPAGAAAFVEGVARYRLPISERVPATNRAPL